MQIDRIDIDLLTGNMRDLDMHMDHQIVPNNVAGLNTIPFVACMYMLNGIVVPIFRNIVSYINICISNSSDSIDSLVDLSLQETTNRIISKKPPSVVNTCIGCLKKSKNITEHMDYGGCMYDGIEF